ncbi:uncharacterized protein LOC133782248 [Humulus lupulus]|uniref:uncharacterized protein LOC133782248 n=1 Tax=Humulus lupulus TaxID=3486 RepID=UPI002B4150AE|nr:uncharacterized protein LOC133782248 [Humulus lupulus]XP_062077471.1 uncharacterized protein LOC133782248 [Humulus lupulus]XP_062077472.1 uncharacterized protein LOC133782248 [Humulus lupulus]
MSMEKGLPQQANNYDCGVYVLKYMEAHSDGNASAYEFDASAERYRFGNLLVCNDFNKGSERFFCENEDHYNKLINLDGSGEIGLFVGNKNGESPQPLLSPVKSHSDSRFSTKKVKRANMIPTVSSRTQSANRNAIARKLQVSIGSGLGCPV